MDFDVLTLSRIQFAMTIMFHYIFPPLSIGLGVILIAFGWLHRRTGDPDYRSLGRFWTQVFAVNFTVPKSIVYIGLSVGTVAGKTLTLIPGEMVLDSFTMQVDSYDPFGTSPSTSVSLAANCYLVRKVFHPSVATRPRPSPLSAMHSIHT